MEGEYYGDEYEVEAQIPNHTGRDRSSNQQMTYDAMAKSISRGGAPSVGSQQVLRGKVLLSENMQSVQGWIPSRQGKKLVVFDACVM